MFDAYKAKYKWINISMTHLCFKTDNTNNRVFFQLTNNNQERHQTALRAQPVQCTSHHQVSQLFTLKEYLESSIFT